jgi:hypothetical protein
LKERVLKYLNYLLSISNDERLVALSIALGLFFGIILPMGLQSIIVVPLALLFRLNIYLSVGSTLITNPVTIAPIYYLAFLIGSSIIGYDINWEGINYVIDSPTYENISTLGVEMVVSLLLGNLILALIFSSASYFFVQYVLKKYKEKKRRQFSKVI